MIYPPIWETLAPLTAVQAALGNPVRFYAFSRAPAAPKLVYPYAVWNLISGVPENALGDAPNIDRFTVQIDIYGTTSDQVRQAAAAVRDGVEPNAHIIGWRGEEKDPLTGNFRVSFDADWFTPR